MVLLNRIAGEEGNTSLIFYVCQLRPWEAPEPIKEVELNTDSIRQLPNRGWPSSFLEEGCARLFWVPKVGSWDGVWVSFDEYKKYNPATYLFQDTASEPYRALWYPSPNPYELALARQSDTLVCRVERWRTQPDCPCCRVLAKCYCSDVGGAAEYLDRYLLYCEQCGYGQTEDKAISLDGPGCRHTFCTFCGKSHSEHPPLPDNLPFNERWPANEYIPANGSFDREHFRPAILFA